MWKSARSTVWLACWLGGSCAPLVEVDFGLVSGEVADGGVDATDSAPDSRNHGGSSGYGGIGGSGSSIGVGGTNEFGDDSGIGAPGGSGGDPNCVPLAGPGMGTCNPLTPCGCLPGQACDVATVDGTTACYNSSHLPLSGACEGLGVCEPGATCIGSGCKRFCSQTGDCLSGASCVAVLGNTDPIPGMKVCTDHCQPWNQYSCTGGLMCLHYPGYGDFLCVPGGTSTGSCTDASQCAPGRVCIDTGSGKGECLKWCRNAADCVGGTKCQAEAMAYWGTTPVSVCY